MGSGGHANIDESWGDVGKHYLSRTTAVGIYPQGASPEGVLDLSRNVWEWCVNEYADPERTQREGRESRVLRGGSWYYDRDLARADDRNYGLPRFRDDDLGFRVLCGSPIR